MSEIKELTFNTIKENAGKTIEIKADSSHAWSLGEIMTALSFDTDKSNFEWTAYGTDTKIAKGGRVVFTNGCEVIVT